MFPDTKRYSRIVKYRTNSIVVKAKAVKVPRETLLTFNGIGHLNSSVRFNSKSEDHPNGS